MDSRLSTKRDYCIEYSERGVNKAIWIRPASQTADGKVLFELVMGRRYLLHQPSQTLYILMTPSEAGVGKREIGPFWWACGHNAVVHF